MDIAQSQTETFPADVGGKKNEKKPGPSVRF
jgi:hypothetical protein